MRDATLLKYRMSLYKIQEVSRGSLFIEAALTYTLATGRGRVCRSAQEAWDFLLGERLDCSWNPDRKLVCLLFSPAPTHDFNDITFGSLEEVVFDLVLDTLQFPKTSTQLSRALQISPTTVSEIRRGIRKPTAQLIEKVLVAMGYRFRLPNGREFNYPGSAPLLNYLTTYCDKMGVWERSRKGRLPYALMG